MEDIPGFILYYDYESRHKNTFNIRPRTQLAGGKYDDAEY
jgi:hypothetical protein